MKKKNPVSKTKTLKKMKKKAISKEGAKLEYRRRIVLKTAKKVSTNIRKIIKSIEGVQPTDLRILAMRILERAQKVSEGINSKK